MLASGHVAFSKLEEVVFGRPAAEVAKDLVDRYAARRVLLMVSGTLRRETDEIARLEAALGDAVAGLFDAMPAHSPRGAILAAAEQARALQADLILTLGGGSVTDGAKALRLTLANDLRDPADFDRLVGAKPDAVAAPTIPQISIPTTLSAGEFSAVVGVTDEASGTKHLLAHPGAVPRAVILDPAIARHTPDWLWISTGVRAVDHCVEGVASAEAHPFGDAQGLKGLELLVRGLTASKADPSNLAARLDCQLGAWLSMGPLTTGVPMGASHGVGYVLGARHGVPHGHTSCIMLPAVMRWNAPANADRQRRIAETLAVAMGEPDRPAADALDAFIRDLGMPRTLREAGVGDADLDAIASAAMRTPWVPRNPRPIAGPADVREILDLAF